MPPRVRAGAGLGLHRASLALCVLLALVASVQSATVTPSASTHGGSLAFYGGTAGAREYGVATLLHSGNDEDQTAYELTFSEPMTCDILLVAGGGGGGVSYTASRVMAGGAGAGGVLLLQDQLIDAGTYTVYVGNGGQGDTEDVSNQRGRPGKDTKLTFFADNDNYVARGGGGGGSRGDPDTIPANEKGGPGGSGGGNCYDGYSASENTGVAGQGSVGGRCTDNGATNYYMCDNHDCGGGGGADSTDSIAGLCDGGNGIYTKNSLNFKLHFEISDTSIGEHVGENVYFGGGGSAGWGQHDADCEGGLGGGANGAWAMNANSGVRNTGGGGAGSRTGKIMAEAGDAAGTTLTVSGGQGGSGVFIIRFRPQSEGTIDDSAPAPAAATAETYVQPFYTDTSPDGLHASACTKDAPSAMRECIISGSFIARSSDQPAWDNDPVAELFDNDATGYLYTGQVFDATDKLYTGAKRFPATGGVAGVLIQVDLGLSIIPSEIKYTPYSASNILKRYKVYASNAASAWTDNDDASWELIFETTSDASWTTDPLQTLVSFTSTTPFRYFTIVVMKFDSSDDRSGNRVLMEELRFEGTIPTPAPAAAAACPTTASGTAQATTTASAWDPDMKAHALTAGQTLVFSPTTPDPLDVSRGFTAVVLARPDAAGQTGDLLTLADTNAVAIAKLGAAAGAVAVECPDAGAAVEPADGATLLPSLCGAHVLNDFRAISSENDFNDYLVDVTNVGNSGGSWRDGNDGTGYTGNTLTITLQNSYEHVLVMFTNSYDQASSVNDASNGIQLKVDDVVRSHTKDAGCAMGTVCTQWYSQSYTGTPVVKIEEIGASVMGMNMLVIVSKTCADVTEGGLGVYALVASDTGAKVYAPDTHGNFLHAGAAVAGCGGFAGVGAVAELVWDFRNKNTEALWDAYALQVNALTNYNVIFHSTYGQSDSFFTANTNEGTFEFTVPSGYDGVRVRYGNSGYSDSLTSADDAVELHWVRPPSTFADPLHSTSTKISEVHVGPQNGVNEITFPTETTFYDVEPGDKLKLVERLSEIYYGIVITFRPKAPGALAGGYSVTLGGPTGAAAGSAFAGLLGEAFLAPRALSRAELGLAIHGLAEYTGDTGADLVRWYTFDGDLSSYHDRADRRRAAAEAEAAAVVGGGQAGGSSPATADTNVNLARACGADGQQACSTSTSGEYDANTIVSKVNNGLLESDGWVSNSASPAWAKIDFGTTREVARVDIYFRTDRYKVRERHTGYEIWIGGDSSSYAQNTECYKHVVADDGEIDTTSLLASVDCIGNGRYLYLVYDYETSSETGYAGASEIKVFAPPDPVAAAASATATLPPVNLARSCGSSGNQPCTVAASSEYSASYAAALANNGIYNDIHESKAETNPWWRVDFQTPKYVSFAKIWLCDYCADRLVGFELWIGDSSTYNGIGNKQCSSGFTFQLSAASQQIQPDCVGSGRYFFMVVPGVSKRINVIEVEVFSAAVYTPAPARRLYALEVAAAQTLDAPVADAFAWTGEWTVAAWLRAGSCPGPKIHWRLKAADPKSLATAITYATDLGGRIPTATELIDYLSTTTDSPWASYDSSTDGTIGVDGNSPLSSNQWTFITDDSNSAYGYNIFQVGNDPSWFYGKVYEYTAASWQDGTGDTHLGYQFAIVDQPCNVLTLVDGAAPPNVAAAVSGADLTPGTWTHVALTYPGSGADAQLHVNGGAGAGTGIDPRAWADGGSVQITGAAVDDLRVYASKALTLAEVQAIAGPDPNAPVAWWKFEDSADLGAPTYGTAITLGLTGASQDTRVTGDYALVLAAAEILVAPVPAAFAWTGEWTVAAWLRAGAGASGAVLSVVDGGAASVDAVQAGDIMPSSPWQGSLQPYNWLTTWYEANVPDNYYTLHALANPSIGWYADDTIKNISNDVWMLFVMKGPETDGGSEVVRFMEFTKNNLPYGWPWPQTTTSNYKLTQNQKTVHYIGNEADNTINGLALIFGAVFDHLGDPGNVQRSVIYREKTHPHGLPDTPTYEHAFFVASTSTAPATPPAWTHVALTHALDAADVQLHVNGGAGAGTGIDPRAWADGGSVQISGAAVDDLRVYTSDLHADLAQAGAPAAAFVAPPPVTYDFTSANTAPDWTAKAKEIDAGATSNTLSWGDFSSATGGTGGVYGNDSGGSAIDGYVKFALPSAYNTITITSGNDYSAGSVYLYIDTQANIGDGSAVADVTWGGSSTSTRWFSYTDGDWLMLKEISGVILGDTVITFSYSASGGGAAR